MPLTMSCLVCGRTGRIPDELRGKKVKCPKCGAAISDKWLFQELGELKGPVSSAMFFYMVNQGEIGPETLVRRNSCEEWMPAVKVPGLFDGTEQRDKSLSHRVEDETNPRPQVFALVTLLALTVLLAYLASVLGRAIIP
jgi:uncharacterized protein DUF4339